MTKYKCIGCGQIHNDNDYCKEDGDIEIKEFNLSDERYSSIDGWDEVNNEEIKSWQSKTEEQIRDAFKDGQLSGKSVGRQETLKERLKDEIEFLEFVQFNGISDYKKSYMDIINKINEKIKELKLKLQELEK